MKGRSKYGAKKTIVDGITFHSKIESERYRYLKSLEGSQVFNLELQPSFVLVPSFKLDGATIRGMSYKADFAYHNLSGEKIIEDVKGGSFRTKEYLLKRKLFQFTYCVRGEFKFFEITTAGDTKTLY